MRILPYNSPTSTPFAMAETAFNGGPEMCFRINLDWKKQAKTY